MAFAAALSEHPVTAYATGEVCGAVLEQLGAHPDVALVFVSLAHAGALEDVMSTVDAVLHPSVVVGAAAVSVIGTGREVEDSPAVSLWAACVGPVLPVRIGPGLDGIPRDLAFTPQAMVVCGDPFSVSGAELLEAIADALGDVPVVGGMAAGARGPGGTRIGLGSQVFSDGAVGALLGPGVAVSPVVSQGCRPIGRPFVVTDSADSIVRALGGRSALSRLDDLAGALAPEEIKAINDGGLHLGLVLDERKLDYAAGDFLVRPVLGGDRETGAIAVGDAVPIGTTVQFHVRDAAAAVADLDRLLALQTPPPDAALLFTCTGRGRGLFRQADHDASAIVDHAGPIPTAGFFSAGEIGPLAGRNELHSFTASLLLFHDSP